MKFNKLSKTTKLEFWLSVAIMISGMLTGDDVAVFGGLILAGLVEARERILQAIKEVVKND